jgi:hypothetical protein
LGDWEAVKRDENVWMFGTFICTFFVHGHVQCRTQKTPQRFFGHISIESTSLTKLILSLERAHRELSNGVWFCMVEWNLAFVDTNEYFGQSLSHVYSRSIINSPLHLYDLIPCGNINDHKEKLSIAFVWLCESIRVSCERISDLATRACEQ